MKKVRLKGHLPPHPASPHLDEYKRNTHRCRRRWFRVISCLVLSEPVKGKKQKRPQIYQQDNGKINCSLFVYTAAERGKTELHVVHALIFRMQRRVGKAESRLLNTYGAADVKVKILPVNHVSCLRVCRGKAGRGLSDFRGQWQPLEVAGGKVIMRLTWWEFKMPECGWWGHRRSLFRSVFCTEILSQCPQRQSHCSQANWGRTRHGGLEVSAPSTHSPQAARCPLGRCGEHCREGAGEPWGWDTVSWSVGTSWCKNPQSSTLKILLCPSHLVGNVRIKRNLAPGWEPRAEKHSWERWSEGTGIRTQLDFSC